MTNRLELSCVTSQANHQAGSANISSLLERESPDWLAPCLELWPKLHKAGREANRIFPWGHAADKAEFWTKGTITGTAIATYINALVTHLQVDLQRFGFLYLGLGLVQGSGTPSSSS